MIDRSFEDLRFICGAGQALDCEWLPSAQHCAALAYCRSLFLMREDIRFAYEGYRKSHVLQGGVGRAGTSLKKNDCEYKTGRGKGMTWSREK